MGTRSLTYFFEDGKPFVCFYRQMDGYPDGHGVELGEIIAKIKIVNGYQSDMKAGTHANGPGCLAAQVVAKLKEAHGIGGIYLTSPELGKDSWQEYEYHVHFNANEAKEWGDSNPAYETFIECRNPKDVIFSGSFEDFLKWARKPPRNADGEYKIVTPKTKAKPVYKNLRTALQHEIVSVRFTKADGSKRLMRCTTDMTQIPEEFHPVGDPTDIVRRDPKLYKVFDLDKQDWRAFREERLLDWTVF